MTRFPSLYIELEGEKKNVQRKHATFFSHQNHAQRWALSTPSRASQTMGTERGGPLTWKKGSCLFCYVVIFFLNILLSTKAIVYVCTSDPLGLAKL